MGFWSSVCSIVGGAISGVCSTIGGVIGKIGSVLSHLGPIFETVANIVEKIAVIIGISEKDEKPEELGLRAEKADKKLEDFDSVKEYKEYLSSIEITDEDFSKINESDISKASYAMAGVAINTKAISEVYGFDTEKLIGALKVINSDLGIESPEDTKVILDKFSEKNLEPNLEGLKRANIGLTEQKEIAHTLEEGIAEIKGNSAINEKVEKLIYGI